MNLRPVFSRSAATRLGWCSLAFFTAISTFAVVPSFAQNLMGGTMSWRPRTDISPNTVEFTITCVFRLRDDVLSTGGTYPSNLLPNPLPTAVGDVFTCSAAKNFKFGETSGPNKLFASADIRWKAVAISTQQNYVVAKLLEKGSSTQTSFLHTYPNAGPWTAETDQWGTRPEYDVKNPKRPMRLGARVETASGNSSPVILQFPPGFVKLPTGGPQPQTFLIPFTDPDANSVVNWRLATRLSGETGSFFWNAPDNLTVDPSSGLVSWDTSQPGISDGSLWSCSFVLEDHNATTNALQTVSMVDIEMVVQSVATGPPSFTSPTCGDTLVVHVGTGAHLPPGPPPGSDACSLTNSGIYAISVSDPHAAASGNRVTVRAASLPAGASFAPMSGYGSASSYIVWNPTNADAGYHSATFEAEALSGVKNGLPVSCDYTILVNRPPDLSGVTASIPGGDPNHLFQPVTISGVSDPDGDSYYIHVCSVYSDEPAGDNCPDAIIKPGANGNTAMVRNERLNEGPADGRVYTINYRVIDSHNGFSDGVAKVCVPRTGSSCVDGGPIYLVSDYCPPSVMNPTLESAALGSLQLSLKVAGMRPGLATIEYTLPKDGDVRLDVFDIAGRQMGSLVGSRQPAGVHRVDWNTTGIAKGVYFYRLIANGQTVSKSILHLQ